MGIRWGNLYSLQHTVMVINMAIQTNQIVNVIPKKIKFRYWAAQLVQDFADSSLPVPPKNEKNWPKWAEVVISKPPFREKGIPSPYSGTQVKYKKWEDWAEILYYMQNYG